jgi:hypothetical protein
MKKVYLIITAVLLAVFVAGCDNFVKPVEGEKPELIWENGRAMIDLNIGLNVGKSRALHDTLAQAGTDFYEVIFVDGTDISRTNWRDGIKIPKLRISLGATPGTGINYDSAGGAGHGYAYIFAGRYSDKTLLGVGKLKDVEVSGALQGNTTINSATTKVIFEVTALENDVNLNWAGYPATTPTAKSFSYTLFAPYKMTIEGVDFPAYQMPLGATTTATFSLSNAAALATAGLDTVAKVANPYTFAGGYKPYISPEDDIKPASIASITTGAAVVADYSLLSAGIPLNITLPAAGSDTGVCLSWIDIPVYLYDSTPVGPGLLAGIGPETWHFRGGLNNKIVDMGYDQMSLGGAILLHVGDLDGGAGSKEIEAGF